MSSVRAGRLLRGEDGVVHHKSAYYGEISVGSPPQAFEAEGVTSGRLVAEKTGDEEIRGLVHIQKGTIRASRKKENAQVSLAVRGPGLHRSNRVRQ